MHYYLTPYVGAGSPRDPFRPRGADDTPFWAAVDLRPDSRVRDGWAVLASANRLSGLRDLGDNIEDPGLVARRILAGVLGLTLYRDRLGPMLLEALLQGREDGTRWRPIQPNRRRVYELYLGGLIARVCAISGGAVFTESFNQANSTVLGPDLSWTELVGNGQTTGNEFREVVGASADFMRADHDTDTSDMYAQAQLVTFALTTGIRWAGTHVRAPATATYTAYRGRISKATSGSATIHWQLHKIIAGVITQLGSDVVATLGTLPQLVRTEASGSGVSMLYGGALQVGPITDTDIAGNTRGGLGLLDNNSTGSCEMDNFEVGDLPAAGGQPTMRRWGGIPGMQYTGRRSW